MSDRLDTAFVEIEPDFSDFNREVEAGVSDAARTLDRELSTAINSLERDFSDFADDISDELRTSFDRIADAGEDSADEIANAYDDVDAAIELALEQALRDARQSFDRIADEGETSAEDIEDAFEDVEREIRDAFEDAQNQSRDSLGRIAEAGEDAASETRFAFEDVDNAIREAFDRSANSVQGSFEDMEREAESALSSIRTEARRTGNEVDDAFQGAGDGIGTSIGAGAEEASDGMDGMGGTAVAAGGTISGAMQKAAGRLGIGAIIAAALAAAQAFVDMGVEALEVSGDLVRIASASEEGFSQVAVDGFRDGLNDIQSELGILTQESVPALQAAIAQGVPEENAISFLETASRSAISTGEDLTDTVSVINGLMAQFGDEFDTAAEAADFLTVTLGNTTANAADVGDVIGEISGFARDAGVDVDELGAAMAAMSITGRDAGTAGGQLAALIEELGDSTTPVAEAFQELSGQSFKEFIAEGGNVQEAAQLIADAAGESGQSVVELAGSAETSSAILALSTEEGAKRFDDALAETRDAMGITEETFGNLEDSGALAMDQLTGSFQTLRDEAGEAVAPLVTQLIDELLPVIEELSPIVTEVGEALLGNFGDTAELIGPLVDLFKLLFDALQPLLESALGPFKDISESVVQIIGDFLIPLLEIIIPILGAVFEILGPILNPAFRLFAWLLGQVADLLSEHVTPQLNKAADVVRDKVVPWINSLGDKFVGLRNRAGGAIDWITDKWNSFTGAIGRGASAVGDFFSGIASTVRGAVNTIIDAWNAIDLSISVSIPSWVPGVGGNTFSVPDLVPDIPRLQTGGFTTDTGIALLHPDEMVLPLSNQSGISALSEALQAAGLSGGGGDTTIIVKIGDRELTEIVDTQVSKNNRMATRRARAGTGRL